VHLLQQEHVAHEVFRAASSTVATLILGRVERKPESIRSRMAKEMNERLRQHGFVGRRGERQNRKLFELCCDRGAVELEPWLLRNGELWQVPGSRSIPGMLLLVWEGFRFRPQLEQRSCSELEGWAEEVFGGLDQEFESEETYVLKSLRVPSNHGA
jgi:hypothetical protein